MATKDLLDHIIRERNLKNDAALGRLLDFMPEVVSKLRKGSIPLSANMILRIHDFTGMDVDKIRQISGIQPKARRRSPSEVDLLRARVAELESRLAA